jgi:proline iminopeptidase
LISDINKVADKLNIERFMLVGPSWGSCLALAYALEHPKRVHSMVLRGIFTGSRDEIDWLKKGLYVRFFPDVYDRFLQETPAERLQDPGDYHTERILSDDSSAAKASALTVSNMELALLSLDDRFTPNTDYEDYDITPARIAAHYISNLCFLPDRHILDNAKKLTMPIWIIQGRYDMLCPPSVAWNLHQELPNSQLIWTLAGHANDRSNYDVQRTLLLQLPEK